MQFNYKMLAAVIAAAAFIPQAGAISIDFSQPTIDLTGGAVIENVTVSGLTAAGQAISGYDLFITFDDTALSLGGISQPTGPFDGPSCSPLCTFSGSNAGTGVLELSLVSFASDAELTSNQGDSVLLASFTATPLGGGTGTSALGFDFSNPLFQVTGLLDPACNDPAGAPGSCPNPILLKFSTVGVPEPSTLALVALGLLGAAFGLRRRSQA